MMRGARIVLVPSHSETFGLVALEGAASGVPVLASSTGGLREVVVLAQGSPEAMQEMIEELLGTEWDDELEVFRYAGDGAPVRWLHKVG